MVLLTSSTTREPLVVLLELVSLLILLLVITTALLVLMTLTMESITALTYNLRCKLSAIISLLSCLLVPLLTSSTR